MIDTSTAQAIANGQPINGDRTPILLAGVATPGISRNMSDTPQDAAVPQATGGGNLNGSANQALLLGQAGTNGSRIDVPRTNAGNYTGVV
jgi:hypothetical protein